MTYSIAELRRRVEVLERRLNNYHHNTPNQYPAAAFAGWGNNLIPTDNSGRPIPNWGGRPSDFFGPQNQWTEEQSKIAAAEQEK